MVGFGEAFHPGLQTVTPSCYVLTWWVAMGGGEKTHFLVSLFIRTLILPDQGPTLMTPFDLNHLLIGPISKYSYIEG